MRKSIILLGLAAMLTSAIMAAPRTQAQMQAAARQAIGQQMSLRHMAPNTRPLRVLRSTPQMDIIGYDNGGFAVVAANDLLPAVMGVSLSTYSHGRNPNFEWWMEATAEAIDNIVAQQAPMQVTKPDPMKYPENVDPLVTTKWYQDEPYNNMCPTFSGSVHCLTGCVATSMAQILNYHKTPAHGIGERTIYYPYNNSWSGEPVTANFEEDFYDWGNMLDYYTEGSYTAEQANAVALLMRDCGVAANMQYGGPDEGSGAYSEDAAQGLKKYFGFEEARCLMRTSYSETEWMNIIYHEISENGPVYYGGADMFMGGHAFLFDGYNASGQVSVNWGWAGDDDGFFYISQLNPAPYNFSWQQDMIVGIKSNNHSLMRTEVVVVTAGGQLQEKLEGIGEEGPIAALTVEGPLNADDLSYLRFLAGRDADGEATEGALRVLDLTKARLTNNTLPDGAFKNCTSLRRVRLPETIAAIGENAFNGCGQLSELRVTCKVVPELLGPDVFEGMPLSEAKLYVFSGLKKKYSQADQWKGFAEQNIYEVGTSVKVRNMVRKYGEKNPQFVYNVNGDSKLVGTPYMYCDASPLSPAGRYPIHISAGTVENSEAYNFVDGYLIVEKIDAVATVETAERFEGEENPTFTLRYEGLFEKETSPVWTKGPVFVTSASKRSRPGEYTVYVESGEAESYNMVFKPGKLIVKENPVPNGIKEVANSVADAPAYNLQGQRVEEPRKGLYVKDGKKYIAR